MPEHIVYYLIKDNQIVPAKGWGLLEVPKNPTTKPTLANHTYVEDQVKWAEEHVHKAIDINKIMRDYND
jgi:hypothetical protein